MIKLTVYFRPPEGFVAHLSSISDKVKINVCINRDDLESCLPDTEILITLFAWPDEELIRLAPRLKWNRKPISLPRTFPSLTMGNLDLILSNQVEKSPGMYRFI